MKYSNLGIGVLVGSALLAGTFSFTDNNQIDMTTYSVNEGGHFSFPRVFKYRRNVKEVTWQIIFNEDCNYIIKERDDVSRDQKDWNKLCGIFYNLFNTREEAAMIGWRYNIENDEIELAPYYHINSGRDMFKPMMTVKRIEPFSVTLTVNRDDSKYIWKLEKEDFETEHEMPFFHKRKLNGFINFYFGGNQAAPQTVSCQMSMEIL